MNIAALVYVYSPIRCAERNGTLVDWECPAHPDIPTAEQIAAAEIEYATYLFSLVPLSKLSLRRALRGRGLESTLDALLASSPQARADWDDATQLLLTDPLVQQMLPVFKAQASLSDSEMNAIIAEAQIR